MLIPSHEFNFLTIIIFSVTCVVLFSGFWAGSASLVLDWLRHRSFVDHPALAEVLS